MQTTFTINLTETQARSLFAECLIRPGVPPESLIEAWVADKLDSLRQGCAFCQPGRTK
jgi:hypothetical protein